MMPQSCIYAGHVVHRRLRPRTHHLSYRCYWLFLDVDELDALSRRLRWFSLSRFNLFSLRNEDHGDGSSQPIGTQARRLFEEANIKTQGCRIFLLTMPRVLGYVFNPLSIYFCCDAEGALRGVIYEVHNTFAERHSYVVATDSGPRQKDHACAKAFYVSPFLGLDLGYDFHLSEPAEKVALAIRVSDAQGPVVLASLAAQRDVLSDASLLKVFFRHPLVTLKVITAIHWEALRLWRKGVPLVPRISHNRQLSAVTSNEGSA